MTSFVEAEGVTHLVNDTTGGEHTLCGDAFDLGTDVQGYAWEQARRRVVTCERCAGIVLSCRRVRVGLV